MTMAGGGDHLAVKGLGTDIVQISRLEASVQRTGDTFLNHVYAPEELLQAPPEGSARRLEYLAGRWAAKEALAKALGCGITAQCRLREIVVLNEEGTGRPLLTLQGEAAKTAEGLGVRRCLVSIAHERDYAVATVITEG